MSAPKRKFLDRVTFRGAKKPSPIEEIYSRLSPEKQAALREYQAIIEAEYKQRKEEGWSEYRYQVIQEMRYDGLFASDALADDFVRVLEDMELQRKMDEDYARCSFLVRLLSPRPTLENQRKWDLD